MILFYYSKTDKWYLYSVIISGYFMSCASSVMWEISLLLFLLKEEAYSSVLLSNHQPQDVLFTNIIFFFAVPFGLPIEGCSEKMYGYICVFNLGFIQKEKHCKKIRTSWHVHMVFLP